MLWHADNELVSKDTFAKHPMHGRLCILMDYCEGGDLTARISEARI